MKSLSKKILSMLASVLTIFSFRRRKNGEASSDAINMPQKDDQIILEDYEIAAYHNHA